jgi:homoserine dehydrogenase
LPHPDAGTPEGAVARLRGAENGLVIRGCDGSVEVVRGTGAGRWPTAQAVLADLLDLLAPGPNDAELGRPVPAGTAADRHRLGVPS